MNNTQTIATSLNQVALIVLSRAYGNLGYKSDHHCHRLITSILISDSPITAWEIRNALWNTFPRKQAADRATCNLFYALGRESELGVIRAETGYGIEEYDSFLSGLSSVSQNAINAYSQK